MLHKYRTGKNQQGFTLTELAIVLGVIGSILAAIWMAAGNVNNSGRVQKAAQEAASILANYRGLYVQHPVDTGAGGYVDITCMGVNAGLFPSDTIQPGVACVTANGATYPADPWGSPAQGHFIAVYGNQDWQNILIQFSGLSQSGCENLSDALMNASDITYVVIDGDTNGDGTNYAPWSTTAIDARCAAGNANFIQIGYKAR